MKKIMVSFDGAVYRPELPGFARLLNTRSRVRLVASSVSERTCARFRRFCDENEIDYAICKDRSEAAVPHIRKETPVADLRLLSSAQFLQSTGGEAPDVFVNELLRSSECPVMLVSSDPWLPGELVFACDDTASVSHAIHQFACLFPEFTRLKATLVCLYDPDHPENAEIPEASAINELGSRHFKRFRILKLRRRTDDFYDTWIRMMDNPWLVCGASGQRERSPLLSHSYATRMIWDHQVPVFMAHP